MHALIVMERILPATSHYVCNCSPKRHDKRIPSSVACRRPTKELGRGGSIRRPTFHRISSCWGNRPRGAFTSRTDYYALFGIVETAAYEIVSPFARSHLIDLVAADAAEQYIGAVGAGEKVDNPHGWIKTTARRRAIDSIRTLSLGSVID